MSDNTQRWNHFLKGTADLKMKIVFLDVRKALKLRGKCNIRNMKTDLKQTMKNFVT